MSDPIIVLDEVELEPDRVDAFLALLESDYRPAAEERGMRLRDSWVTPPEPGEGAPVSCLLVWELDGIEGFWRMRSQSGTPEVWAFWERVDALVLRRTRRYAVAAEARERVAMAGRVHA